MGYDGAYEKGFCKLYESEIPSTLPSWTHRICSDFRANEHFNFYIEMNPLEERFSWFQIELKKGVLYGFHYDNPSGLDVLKNLVEKS